MARQLWLLRVHARAEPWRFDVVGKRMGRVIVDGILQRRLATPSWAGLAHLGIFFGFLTFLPRTLVLFGRAFDPGFGAEPYLHAAALGEASAFHAVQLVYAWIKDAMALVVLLGTVVFAGLRVGHYRARLQPSASALLILAAIAAMMLGDLLYDGAGIALSSKCAGAAGSNGMCASSSAFLAPFAGLSATEIGRTSSNPLMQVIVTSLLPLDRSNLLRIGLTSYCLHLALVGLFLVALPHTKHLHLVSVWPKLFLSERQSATPRTIVSSPEALLELVERELESSEPSELDPSKPAPPEPAPPEPAPHTHRSSKLGRGVLAAFSAQERLDWFACTQCGRCSAQCPATATGKALDPRRLTVQLRAQLERTPINPERAARHLLVPLVPEVISPEALWACTQCGACEVACPVGIRYVGPILELRRHQFMLRGAAPPALARVFQGLERRRNPYGFPHDDRAKWADGLDVPRLKDVERVEYLYWVGCAASYDDRGRSVARALVRLMQRAQVSFAILGTEEHCTGDVARRTGNELLYLQLANRNVELLNRYQVEGRFQRILTTCPHCLTTLGQQYPDLGGNYELVSHVVAIEQWMNEGRLPKPSTLERRAVYHDPCNLARLAGETTAPRRILGAIPGLRLFGTEHEGQHTFCCGAGGGQAWLEEVGERINERRADELRATGADCIVSACPFCLSMLNEGMKGADGKERPRVCDVAELVELSCRQAEGG